MPEKYLPNVECDDPKNSHDEHNYRQEQTWNDAMRDNKCKVGIFINFSLSTYLPKKEQLEYF